MERQKVRVILASEHPQTRSFVREVVEEEDGAVIVGQSANASKALTLARNLRPDVAIIDCYLPHTIGLDGIPLSRTGGLDTAQTISREIPNTRVVLIPNLDTEALPEHGLTSDYITFFSRQPKEAKSSFTLQELSLETGPLDPLVFANVVVQQRHSLRQKIANISDKAVLLGGLGTVGGLSLILTMILAGPWGFLALLGGMTMLLGLVGKVAIRLWPSGTQERPGKGGQQ